MSNSAIGSSLSNIFDSFLMPPPVDVSPRDEFSQFLSPTTSTDLNSSANWRQDSAELKQRYLDVRYTRLFDHIRNKCKRLIHKRSGRLATNFLHQCLYEERVDEITQQRLI